jgi:uncharacterized protein
MERLFVDTSAWFAFSYRTDPQHAQVKKGLSRYEGRLVTSNFIFDEVLALFTARISHAAAAAAGEMLLEREVVDLVRVTPDDEQVAWRLFLSRPDRTYSFTDCTSFVMIRRLGIKRVASLDDDFRQEGFDVIP